MITTPSALLGSESPPPHFAHVLAEPLTQTDRNILKGILDSHNFLQLAAEIPCDIIETLETDAAAAELFVDQIKNGTVPTIIKDLPEEIIDAFGTLVTLALKLPTALLSAAESAVTEAVHIFDDIEDGKIVGDIESLPGEVETDVTSLWGDLTSDVVAGWNEATHGIACFFEGGCASATTGACLSTSGFSGSTTPLATPSSTTATQTPESVGVYTTGASTASQASTPATQTAQSSYYPIVSTPDYSSSPWGPRPSVGYVVFAVGLLYGFFEVLRITR